MAEFDMGGGLKTWHGPVYKYKSLSGPGLTHVKEIIGDRLIFVPTPAQLNDPLECKPAVVIGDISDPAYRPAVERWVRRCIAARDPVPTEAQIVAELRGLTQAGLEDMVARFSPEYHVAIDQRYRILSFADAPDNHHLWTHYAANYAGVCLEFDFPADFAVLHRVQYSDTLNAFDITDDESNANLIVSALVKKTAWKNESECRLILGEPPAAPDDPVLRNQKLFVGERLTGVIFGSEMRAEHRAELLSLLLPGDRSRVRVATGRIPYRRFTIT